MKSIKYILFFFFVGLIAACSGNQNNSGTTSSGQPLPGPTTYPPPGQNANTNTTTTLPAGSVQHYTCPSNCEGSGGSVAGTCPVCGTEYVHNAAFHAQTTATTPTTTTITSSPTANQFWSVTCLVKRRRIIENPYLYILLFRYRQCTDIGDIYQIW